MAGSVELIEDLIADIAAVFHWQPEVLLAMPLRKLVDWQQRAIGRWNLMHGAE